MTIPGPFRAGDVASMLLDLVPDDPCSDDTVACALRSLVDYMVPLTLVFGACVILGLVLALSFSIVTARQETPFGSVDDLANRGVVGPSTLEKIRALISVGP